MTTLYVLKDGIFQVAEAHDILRCAHDLVAYYYQCGELVLSEYPKSEAFLKLHLGLEEYEVFGLLHLNADHRLIAMEDLFRGTVDTGPVHAREVVRSVIHHNSTAVVLYHNHPSGNARPSEPDRAMGPAPTQPYGDPAPHLLSRRGESTQRAPSALPLRRPLAGPPTDAHGAD